MVYGGMRASLKMHATLLLLSLTASTFLAIELPKECIDEISRNYEKQLSLSTDKFPDHEAIMREVRATFDVTKCMDFEIEITMEETPASAQSGDKKNANEPKQIRTNLDQTQEKLSYDKNYEENNSYKQYNKSVYQTQENSDEVSIPEENENNSYDQYSKSLYQTQENSDEVSIPEEKENNSYDQYSKSLYETQDNSDKVSIPDENKRNFDSYEDHENQSVNQDDNSKEEKIIVESEEVPDRNIVYGKNNIIQQDISAEQTSEEHSEEINTTNEELVSDKNLYQNTNFEEPRESNTKEVKQIYDNYEQEYLNIQKTDQKNQDIDSVEHEDEVYDEVYLDNNHGTVTSDSEKIKTASQGFNERQYTDADDLNNPNSEVVQQISDNYDQDDLSSERTNKDIVSDSTEHDGKTYHDVSVHSNPEIVTSDLHENDNEKTESSGFNETKSNTEQETSSEETHQENLISEEVKQNSNNSEQDDFSSKETQQENFISEEFKQNGGNSEQENVSFERSQHENFDPDLVQYDEETYHEVNYDNKHRDTSDYENTKTAISGFNEQNHGDQYTNIAESGASNPEIGKQSNFENEDLNSEGTNQEEQYFDSAEYHGEQEINLENGTSQQRIVKLDDEKTVTQKQTTDKGIMSDANTGLDVDSDTAEQKIVNTTTLMQKQISSDTTTHIDDDSDLIQKEDDNGVKLQDKIEEIKPTSQGNANLNEIKSNKENLELVNTMTQEGALSNATRRNTNSYALISKQDNNVNVRGTRKQRLNGGDTYKLTNNEFKSEDNSDTTQVGFKSNGRNNKYKSDRVKKNENSHKKEGKGFSALLSSFASISRPLIKQLSKYFE